MSVLGTIVSDLKKAGHDIKFFFLKVAGDAPAVMSAIAKDEAAIAPVIEAFIPGSAKAIQVSDTVLNAVAQAVEDAGAAAGSNALNVSLDQSVVADVKLVIAAAKAAFPAKAAALVPAK